MTKLIRMTLLTLLCISSYLWIRSTSEGAEIRERLELAMSKAQFGGLPSDAG
jgi:hypothetical protein